MSDFNEPLSPAELLKKFGTNGDGDKQPKFKNPYVNELLDEQNQFYREHCFNRISYSQYDRYIKIKW